MQLPKFSIVPLLWLCFATAGCSCPFDRDGVLNIARKVETELPLGSTPPQVAKFLDDMHIEHTGHIRIFDTHRYDKLDQITANIVSHAEPAGNLVFFFRDGKLVEWWVESGCGGGCYSMRGNKPMYRNGVTNECYDP
jgi:hypothetical protein